MTKKGTKDAQGTDTPNNVKATAARKPPKDYYAMKIDKQRLHGLIGHMIEASAPLSTNSLLLMATGSKPCICEASGEQGTCLRFWLDEHGRYSYPPGGEAIDCATCHQTCHDQ